MAENVRQVGNLVRTNPNLQRAVAFLGTGPGGPGAMNTARVVLRMKPRAERVNTAQEIVQQTRPLLARFPGYRTFVTLPPAFQIGGRQGDSTYSVTLRSPDTVQLYDWAGRFQQAIATLPDVPGRLERPGDQEPARPAHDRFATRRPRWPSIQR